MPRKTDGERAAEDMFHDMLVARGIPDDAITREFRFAKPERNWSADFYIKCLNLLLEVEGGVWTEPPGRHIRPRGFSEDCRKYNDASVRGYRLLRTTTSSDMMRETADAAAQLYQISIPQCPSSQPPA